MKIGAEKEVSGKRNLFYRHCLVGLSGFLALGLLQACTQLMAYRSAFPGGSPAPPRATPSPSVTASPPKASEPRKPLPAESNISEQDLGEGRMTRLTPTIPSPVDEIMLKESGIRETDLGENRSTSPYGMREESAGPRLGGEAISTQAEELSLIAKITPETSPQHAVSLRLAEEGRKLLETQEYEKGLSKLEKAITIDSRNRYGYYYLAKAHYHLTHYVQSLNFLEIAESTFVEEPNWLARVFSLRGNNYDALNLFERADVSYTKALKLDPNNRVAFERITEIKLESPAPSH